MPKDYNKSKILSFYKIKSFLADNQTILTSNLYKNINQKIFYN